MSGVSTHFVSLIIVLFPGGGVDKNEEITKAMVRETKEETDAVVKKIRKLGKIKIFWGPNWAKTEKQKYRYTAFQGDEMHFFIGNIERFEEPEIKK